MAKNKSITLASLKFLTETSFYVSLMGVLLAFMRSVSPIFISYSILFLCNVASCALREKKALWLLPQIAALSAFYVEFSQIGQAVNALWILPIWIYGIIWNARRMYTGDFVFIKKMYKYGVFLTPFCGFAASGLSHITGGDNGALAFSIVFIIGGMLCMRYARHRNASVATPYFNRLNAVSVIAIVGGTAAVYLSFIGLYRLIIFLLGLIPDGISGGSSNSMQTIPPKTPVVLPTAVESAEPTPRPIEPEKNNSVAAIGIIVIVAIITFLLVYYIMKHRDKKLLFDSNDNDVFDPLSDDVKKPHTLRDLSNRAKVRRLYRKFMQLCREKYIEISPSSTAREICDAAKNVGFSSDECDALYHIYTLARYSSNIVSDEDAKLAGLLYRKLKAGK